MKDKIGTSRTGMIYTSFALLASSVLLMLMLVNVGGPAEIDDSTAIRINEASFFLDSMLNDMDRTLEMGTRRALGLAIDYIVSSGNSMHNPTKNISSALEMGELHESSADNFSMESASLEAWERSIEENVSDRAGYKLSVNFTKDPSFDVNGLELESNHTVSVMLEDPVTRVSFNRTHTAQTHVSIEGLEDTMITLRSNGDYISTYRECGFSDPAEQIEDYSGDSSDIENNESLINQSGDIWHVRFHKMFNTDDSQGCYVSDPSGPDFFDRLRDDNVAGGEAGIATLINLGRLPEADADRSAVGHVYFGDPATTTCIRGVSDRPEYSWFRLDQEHVAEEVWNLTELAYDCS